MAFWCHGQAGGWAGWLAMTIMAVLAVIATLTFVVLWRGSRARRQDLDAHDPEAVLAARFARGEIDEQEYLERRDALARLVH